MVEPLLWRPLGWCRLEVDVAGRQRSKGEGEAQRGQLRAVLPVGTRRSAEELARPPRPGPAARAVTGAASRPLEEPAPLPDARAGAGRTPASRRRAAGSAASPAGCRSRRCRACATCRARCSGGCASRACTSTRPGEASTPRCATATSPRPTGRSSSSPRSPGRPAVLSPRPGDRGSAGEPADQRRGGRDSDDHGDEQHAEVEPRCACACRSAGRAARRPRS